MGGILPKVPASCSSESYLVQAVDEIKWEDRLCKFNHNPHVPYLVTHFTDSMPVASIGGALSNALWNPKYATDVFKVTVANDNLGNSVHMPFGA